MQRSQESLTVMNHGCLVPTLRQIRSVVKMNTRITQRDILPLFVTGLVERDQMRRFSASVYCDLLSCLDLLWSLVNMAQCTLLRTLWFVYTIGRATDAGKDGAMDVKPMSPSDASNHTRSEG